MGNFLLVSAGSAGGSPTGIVPDLATRIASKLGVEIDWVPYPNPGQLSDAAKGDPAADAWDVAFIGAEPARAKVIDFTSAYVEIEASYLVQPGSAIQAIDEVDRPGVRVAAAARAAYELYLRRSLKHAELVTAEGLDGSFDLFREQNIEALAGLTVRLLSDQKRLPGSRVLPGRFTAVQQAIATPAGRPSAFAMLRAFAEQVKADGTVARLIERHGVQGLSVAPLGMS